MKDALVLMVIVALVTLTIGVVTIGYTIGELIWTPQVLM
jgi:hypothetical protein